MPFSSTHTLRKTTTEGALNFVNPFIFPSRPDVLHKTRHPNNHKSWPNTHPAGAKNVPYAVEGRWWVNEGISAEVRVACVDKVDPLRLPARPMSTSIYIKKKASIHFHLQGPLLSLLFFFQEAWSLCAVNDSIKQLHGRKAIDCGV